MPLGRPRSCMAEALQDEGQIARVVAAAAESEGATLVVAPHDHVGRAVAPRVAVRLGAGMVPGVTGLIDGASVKRNVFSGKAMAHVRMDTDTTVVTTTPNAFGVASDGAAASVEAFHAEAGEARLSVTGFESSSEDGSVPLPEAVRVVSAGRGLKGPENWGIVEDLAQAMQATRRAAVRERHGVAPSPRARGNRHHHPSRFVHRRAFRGHQHGQSEQGHCGDQHGS